MVRKKFEPGIYDVRSGRGGRKSQNERDAFAALDEIVNGQEYSRLHPKIR